MEHLIANSGIQFISREITFNPSSRPIIDGGKPLDYYFIEKQETDEITGEEEILFDFLCPSNNGYVPLKELFASQEDDQQLEVLPSGGVRISESGLPFIKKDADMCLYSTYQSTANGVFHIPTLESMHVNKAATSLERVPIYKLFLDKWLPFPLFEEHVNGISKSGPNGWCRVKIELLEESRDGKNSYRITWALDTDLSEDLLEEERVQFEINEKSTKKFSLCNVADKLMGFLFSEKEENGFSSYAEYIIGLIDLNNNADILQKIKYLAYYIYFVNFIRLTDNLEIEVHHRPNKAIDVDLVLDIGNSRTCGVLFEKGEIAQGKMLQLRDLTRPWVTYEDSFDMRVVLRKADFGSDIRSSDDSLFAWNSILRIGEEAKHLIYSVRLSEGKDELTTNYSSPKRYLWDDKEFNGNWDFLITKEDSTSVRASASIYIKELTSWFDNYGYYTNKKDPSKTGRKYSRGSLMTFVFIEIFQQAFMYINSIGYRNHYGSIDCPRRIRKIIVTAPTAMPNKEQITLRKSAVDAHSVLNKIHAYWKNTMVIPDIDNIKTKSLYDIDSKKEWCYDEATASHFVYLYSEIIQKYNGDIGKFIESKGHVRPESVEKGYDKKSLTLASIDIGAGTTDIMICSYQYSGEGSCRLKPVPLFWDSFYLAGDDIVKNIIKKIVINSNDNQGEMVGSISNVLRKRLQKMNNEDIGKLPIVEKTAAFELLYDNIIRSVGKEERELHINTLASNMIENYFGVDAAGMNYIDKICRLDFNTQISVPIAQFFMEQLRLKRPSKTFSYDEIFSDNKPTDYLLEHFEKHFGFSIKDVEWRFDPDEIALIVSKTLETLMRHLSIILNAYHIDALILAGRPASLDAVTDLFIKYYPVSPDRLVRLSQYHVGKWYPLATDKGYFVDQKSVVAVGAMVAHLASTDGFPGLSVDLESLAKEMHSTSNYMGIYNPDTFQIKNVFLSPSVNHVQVTIDNFPAFIGCKQLNVPEYHSRPTFAIYNKSKINPLKITLSRDYGENRELLKVEDVTDSKNNTLPNSSIELVSQSIAEIDTGTSHSEKTTFWLDNGAFKYLDA